MFAVNKVHTFNAGLVRSRQLLDKFNRASAASPGTGADFQTIFKAAAPTLLANVKGITDNEITQFASRGLAAAFTLRAGAGTEQVGSELNQILAGQAGADNALFSSIRGQLFKNLGIRGGGAKGTEAFNKKAAADGRKTFEALLKTLADLDDANAAFGQTVTGLFGTLKQQANDLTNTAFRPLFTRMRDGFAGFVKEITDSKSELNGLAKLVGEKLAGAWDMLRRATRAAADNMNLFIVLGTGVAMKRAVAAFTASAALGGVGVGPVGLARGYAAGAIGAGSAALGGARRAGARAVGLAGRPVGAALGFAGDFLFGRAIGGPASGRRGARLAAAGRTALAQSGGSLLGAGFNLAGGVGRRAGAGIAARATTARAAIGSALVRNGGVQGLAAAGLAKGAAVGAGAIKGLTVGLLKFGIVAAPLIVIAGMLAGTFLVLKDSTNEATQFLKTSFSELRIALDSVAAQFGFTGASGGFGGMLKRFATWLGTGVVGVLGLAVKGVELVVSAFGRLVSAFQAIGLTIGQLFEDIKNKNVGGLRSIGDNFKNNFEAAEKARKAAILDAMKREQERRKRDADEEAARKKRLAERKAREAAAAALLKKEKENARKGRAKVQVNVTNQNTIVTDADPDKVALSVEEINATSILDAIQSVGLPFDVE